jgi:hypothetical protein
MSNNKNLMALIASTAIDHARQVETAEKEFGPLDSEGYSAIEDLYFLAGHSQELQGIQEESEEREDGLVFEDEELIIMLCLAVADHVRDHPNVSTMSSGGGTSVH